MHSAPFQLNEKVAWEDLGNGIERQLFGFDQTIMMVKVKFKKGAIGELHSHPHTQVSYVESGSFEMTIGEDKTTLHAGDGFYVQPGVLHGTVCLEPGNLVDTFSPAREDFLPNGSAL